MKLRKPWKGTRRVHVSLNMPAQFLMLCDITMVSPERVLQDIVTTLAMENYGPGKEQQEMMTQYFLKGGYGQDKMVAEDVLAMFSELRAVSLLWPENAKPKMATLHVKWRKMYYRHWYLKWRAKGKR